MITPIIASADPWILCFSLFTVIATIVMGFWSARKAKTASDFFVAGRSVSVGWNASAISGEYLSAASFMGIAGMVMSSGYDALWYPVCYACGYLFLLLFIAGPLRRFGAYTIPDFAEGRFDSPLFRKIAVIFVLFIGFFYTMPQMKGAGTTLAYIFPGLPYAAGVVLVGAVITLNVALGGMKGITLVQAFQYWAKMFAISVPVFVLMSVYGHYGKQLEMNSGHGIGAVETNLHRAAMIEATKHEVKKSLHAGSISNLTNISSDAQTMLQMKAEEDAIEAQTRGDSAHYKFVSADPNQTKPFTLEDLTKTPPVKGPSFPEKPNITANFGKQRAREMLSLYQQVSGRPMFISEDAKDTMITNSLRLVKATPSEFGQKLEAILASNQLAIIPFNDIALVTPTSKSTEIRAQLKSGAGILSAPSTNAPIATTSEFRRPLPEKAPQDAAWIAPFGPLTTKAAKAAKLSPQEARPLSLLYTYSLIIAIVCGTAGLPHILVRFYTNPDGMAAKRTTMWVMILIGIFYVFPPVFGVMGRNLLPELYNGIGAKGTDKIVLELPRMLNERVPMLGSILSGVTCAGAFAAFMSTFSGLLVSMTGAMAHDVYGRILKPNSTPEQRMKAFKIAAFGIGAVAVLLGSFVEKLEINFMVGQAFAIAAASYFPLLFMAVWWRNLTMKGAATGMLAGGCLSVVAISLTSFTTLASGTDKTAELFSMFKPLNGFWAAHPLLRILCEQPAIWAVPLAIILMIIVSKLTKSQVPADIRMKMLVLHAPEKLGLKQEYIQEHQSMH